MAQGLLLQRGSNGRSEGFWGTQNRDQNSRKIGMGKFGYVKYGRVWVGVNYRIPG